MMVIHPAGRPGFTSLGGIFTRSILQVTCRADGSDPTIDVLPPFQVQNRPRLALSVHLQLHEQAMIAGIVGGQMDTREA
jgi:hypothetical protein